jgi:transcriptional regulator with XRE-family HTH domain
MRRERERRQITLDAIAATTKISMSHFEALERDDVSKWPTGIFRRAFIRAYADAIGLDPDEVVQAFQERFPDTGDEAAEFRVPKAVAVKRRPARPGDSAFRLSLADVPGPFSGGEILTSGRARLIAAGVDLSLLLAMSTACYLVLGHFLTSLGVCALLYYVGGIVLLGNSPGVCMVAPPINRVTEIDEPEIDEPEVEPEVVRKVAPRSLIDEPVLALDLDSATYRPAAGVQVTGHLRPTADVVQFPPR